jgi:hypothetical protein
MRVGLRVILTPLFFLHISAPPPRRGAARSKRGGSVFTANRQPPRDESTFVRLLLGFLLLLGPSQSMLRRRADTRLAVLADVKARAAAARRGNLMNESSDDGDYKG